MPKSSYYWSHEEFRKLMELWDQGERDVKVLAAAVNRKPTAIRKQLQSLGLFVVAHKKNFSETTTSKEQSETEEETRIRLEALDRLPSVEEVLVMVAAAVDRLAEPGLSKVEISRLKAVVRAGETYQRLLADFINYRQIEEKLVEMEKKYNQWLKEKLERSKELNVEARTLRRVWRQMWRTSMIKRRVTKEGR